MDVLNTTGANIIHDLIDVSMGIGHYIGSSNVDADELFNLRINRIYNVYLLEDNYATTEKDLLEKIEAIFPNKDIMITPSEFLQFF
ncbi:MAG: deoxyhypusine synthase family protein [Candidatus Lokiarchaeota archaeon]|nr:deoxyhypusine synthase family protein [Candidatus Lokiarchaeota archaeon]